MTNEDGLPLEKMWKVMTTENRFHDQFHSKRCPGCPNHGRIEGKETAKTAFYPKRMCSSIVHCWQRINAVEEDGFTNRIIKNGAELFNALHLPMGQEEEDHIFQMSSEEYAYNLIGGIPNEDPVTPDGWDEVDARLHHLHKAAGHPNNRNLARTLKDAGKPAWLVKRALKLKCIDCEKIKAGAQMIPRASLTEIPKAWQVVAADVAEVNCPGTTVKLKFVLFMDIATNFVSTSVLKECHASGRATVGLPVQVQED